MPDEMDWPWASVSGLEFMVSFSPPRVSTREQSVVQSAIKIHQRGPDYARKRDVYLRLKEHRVETIRGCHVPRLLSHDDELWVIDMTIVTRPFALDFAGATLDERSVFSEEVLAAWHAEKQEQFGQRWNEVQAILRFLERYGIFLMDVNGATRPSTTDDILCSTFASPLSGHNDLVPCLVLLHLLCQHFDTLAAPVA